MSLQKAKKVLVLRFSSIGDIILTTPVVRCLHEQIGCQVHYLTKSRYSELLLNNPYIGKVYSFKETWKEVKEELIKENYDLIIDLHKNLRSKRVISGLKVPSQSYHKANMDKWMLVHLKLQRNSIGHLVDRYFKALDISNDGQGLDYFLAPDLEQDLFEKFNKHIGQKYLIVNLGATHKTKRIPYTKINGLLEHAQHPVLLLGGEDVSDVASRIVEKPGVVNLVGRTSLSESAFLIKHATAMVTGDSGMMHVGAAFNVPMMVLWGSTVPELGMYPYSGSEEISHYNVEVKSLKCRPCSKIGKAACPKGHFLCMNAIPMDKMVASMNNLLDSPKGLL